MDTWDLMREWYLVLPPSRPSALQIARIRKQILGVDKHLPVAVLGSTPEFRDLLHETGFEQIYVLDRNAKFYTSMGEGRVYDNAEHFVRGDWLETLGTYNSKFAVILSDLTSGNIPYNDRREFYKGIANALTHEGLFFDKVLTHHGAVLSVDRLIEKYSDLPLNLVHINNFSSEMLFCSELIDLNQTVDSTLFYNLLNERVENRRVRAFVKHSKKITPPGCIWWYGRRWSQLTSDYCPDLTLTSVDEDEPLSPYYGNLKFFQLTKGK